MGQAIRFVVMMFIAKMLLYIAGFMLAIKFDDIFNDQCFLWIFCDQDYDQYFRIYKNAKYFKEVK